MPRWCDLLWCLTMVVFRQKLERTVSMTRRDCGIREMRLGYKRTSSDTHHERICTGACPCESCDASQERTTVVKSAVGPIVDLHTSRECSHLRLRTACHSPYVGTGAVSRRCESVCGL